MVSFEDPEISVSFPSGTSGKELTCQCRRQKRRMFALWAEKEMVIHSRILAWRIPWTEKPGRLYSSWGGKRVRHN